MKHTLSDASTVAIEFSSLYFTRDMSSAQKVVRKNF